MKGSRRKKTEVEYPNIEKPEIDPGRGPVEIPKTPVLPEKQPVPDEPEVIPPREPNKKRK